MKNSAYCFRTSLLSAALLLLGALIPQAASGAGLDTISAYAGTWTSHIVYNDTAYSKARIENTNLRNDCWRSAGYFACDQFVNGPSTALIVFTYDAVHDVYHNYVIPTDGSPATSGKVLVAGNTWTYPWRERIKGNVVYFRVRNVFRDAKTIAFRQEFSLDNRHWTQTARGIEHRISP